MRAAPGTYAAAAPAVTTTTAAVVIVPASNGRTSKSRLDSSRLVTSDSPMPSDHADGGKRAGAGDHHARIPRRVAPSAMRTPISRDRSATQ